MKLITIWLINKCNFNCYYCTARGGIEPTDFNYPDESVVARNSNKLLLPWLEKYCPPNEWLLEFTGGEPGLYPEINTLIPELTARGYSGVIQTNGSLFIPKSSSFVRTAAWHENNRPIHYDSMIIIKTGNFMEKIKWCKENGVKFRLTNLNESFRKTPSASTDTRNCKITHYAFMNAYGQLANCYKGPFKTDNCIRLMSPPPVFELAKSPCPKCGNVKAVEYALGLD